MKTRADLAEIRIRMLQNVAVRGYDVISPIEGLDAKAAARDPWEIAAQIFGEPPSMVEQQPIKPVSQGRSFASNMAFTPLHTDSQQFCGVSPHVQLMFCAKAARDGGTTLLLDTHALLETIQREDATLFNALFTEPRLIPFVFGDVEGPTVSWRADCVVFTHSPMQAKDEIGRKLEAFLSRASAIEVSVPDGHILVVDNHRMLHGRTAFTDPERRFTRLLVWLQPKQVGAIHASSEWRRFLEERVEGAIDEPPLRDDPRESIRRDLSIWPLEEFELRRRIVLEMLRGVPPGVLVQRYRVPEPKLYEWRDDAIAAIEEALE